MFIIDTIKIQYKDFNLSYSSKQVDKPSIYLLHIH